MRKLQITGGEAKIFNECFINEYGFYTQPISISSRNGILLSNAYGKNKNEAIANAQLIADAFNTANKCDMLPSELLELLNEVYTTFKLDVDSFTKENVDTIKKLQNIFKNDTP